MTFWIYNNLANKEKAVCPAAEKKKTVAGQADFPYLHLTHAAVLHIANRRKLNTHSHFSRLINLWIFDKMGTAQKSAVWEVGSPA